MRLRQLALVAHELEPLVDDLRAVLGLGEPFRDPGVSMFGLHNAVFTIGDTFLEVVSPVERDTSAGRYLARQGGDGGYMVILQSDDLQADRKRAEELGVRVVWETTLPDIATVHFHPRDAGGAILSLDAAVPPGSWRWAGPGWEERQGSAVAREIVGAGLAARDPGALAQRWSELLARPQRRLSGGGDADSTAQSYEIALERGRLRFIEAPQGGPEGLCQLEIEVADPTAMLDAARARSLPVESETPAVVRLGGARFLLREQA